MRFTLAIILVLAGSAATGLAVDYAAEHGTTSFFEAAVRPFRCLLGR
jgi:spore maturation protein SpmB